MQIAQDNADTHVGGNNMPAQNNMSMSVQLIASEQSGADQGRPWWRGMCPISLLCPTVNDTSIVHRLPDPIMLRKGDAIEPLILFGTVGQRDQMMGLSFVGYIEMERG